MALSYYKFLIMSRPHYFIILLLVFLSACKSENNNSVTGKVLGYKPVYSTSADLYLIQNKPARAVTNAGKIYVKDNYIFQNEIGEGIHIFNNSNPANTLRSGFITIKGSQEIAIKSNFLYSNNYDDLVVVDITDVNNVKEVNRIKNIFYKNNFQLSPPAGSGYFECADNSKGIVINWVRDSINNPTCRN